MTQRTPMHLTLSGLLIAGATACSTGPDRADGDMTWPVGDADTMWEERYLVGSYRNIDEIVPVRNVRASSQPMELPESDPIGNFEYRYGGDTLTLEHYIEGARMTGLIAIRDGTVRLERYAYGAEPGSRLTGMSMTKSVVSTLVGFALEDGLIESLSDPIDRYVPELARSGYAGVAIESVLQMSSGIDFSEQYGNPYGDSARLWDAVASDRSHVVEEFLLQRDSERRPDTQFNYNPLDTQALGWLVREVTGKSLAQYLEEKVWRPAGMRGYANWALDGTGAGADEVAYCCLNARLRDWARLGMLFAGNGEINGKQLLSSDWIERATSPSRPHLQPGELYEDYPLGYQYQWWTFPAPEEAFVALGINGQFLYIDPTEDFVVVSTAAWRDYWDTDLEQEFYAIAERLRELTASP